MHCVGDYLSHSSFGAAEQIEEDLSRNTSVCMSLLKVRLKDNVFEDGLLSIAGLYLFFFSWGCTFLLNFLSSGVLIFSIVLP